jgi:hypothetical protein
MEDTTAACWGCDKKLSMRSTTGVTTNEVVDVVIVLQKSHRGDIQNNEMNSHVRIHANRVVIKHTMLGRRTQEALLN